MIIPNDTYTPREGKQASLFGNFILAVLALFAIVVVLSALAHDPFILFGLAVLATPFALIAGAVALVVIARRR